MTLRRRPATLSEHLAREAARTRAIQDQVIGLRGYLGHAEKIADQTLTGDADVTSLVVTVDLPPGRRVRVRASCQALIVDDGGNWSGFIQEGATRLKTFWRFRASLANRSLVSEASVLLTPAAGTHTYKVRFERVGGTGDLVVTASTDNPAFIEVEDVGAV